ncbi:MAG TPA: pyruvate formate-lyase-activating protein [Pyrinomonadaceae bacterium]|jgi:pyruvate formate lyase activating enzyme
MNAEATLSSTPLTARSPYELRVNLSKNVPENYVKQALETGETGFLHSFTTGSTVDGPGVRLVGWTSGCQFKCLYCHNPDTWKMMNGLPVTLERAAEELSKYQHGLRIMRGGLTLSGGEPLMQDRFAVRLFAIAQKMRIHTALDTNGSLGARLSDAELEKIDLVMLCIKSLDPVRHRALTGKDLAPTLEFAHRLAERKRPVWLRFVLVPGLTDDEQQVDEMAKFAAGLGVCEHVDILPFHQLGQYKWEKLGLQYPLANVEPPTAETIKRVCEQFHAEGLTAY